MSPRVKLVWGQVITSFLLVTALPACKPGIIEPVKDPQSGTNLSEEELRRCVRLGTCVTPAPQPTATAMPAPTVIPIVTPVPVPPTAAPTAAPIVTPVPVPPTAAPTATPTNPPAVTSGVVAAPSSTEVTISWNVSPNSTGQIFYGTSSTTLSTQSLKETNYLSYHAQRITGLLSGRTYYYSIESTTQAGVTIRDTIRSFTTTAAATPVPTAVPAPTVAPTPVVTPVPTAPPTTGTKRWADFSTCAALANEGRYTDVSYSVPTSLEPRPAYTYPNYQSVVPSDFGKTVNGKSGPRVYRLTGDGGTTVPGYAGLRWKTVKNTGYQNTPAWSADGTVLRLYKVVDSWALYLNGEPPYNILGPRLLSGDIRNITWHPDPGVATGHKEFILDSYGNLLLGDPMASGTALMLYRANGNNYGSFLKDEGQPAYNKLTGKTTVAWNVENGGAAPRTLVVDMDGASNVRLLMDVAAGQLTAWSDSGQISRDGRWLFLAGNSASTGYVFDLNYARTNGAITTTNWQSRVVGMMRSAGHFDSCVAMNGDEILWASGSGDFRKFIGLLVGKLYPNPGNGDFYHTSCRHNINGWGIGGNESTLTAMGGEVWAQQLYTNGTRGEVRRFFHHRAGMMSGGGVADYDYGPWPSPSWDGTRFIVTSNWTTDLNIGSGKPTDLYLVDLRDICELP